MKMGGGEARFGRILADAGPIGQKTEILTKEEEGKMRIVLAASEERKTCEG